MPVARFNCVHCGAPLKTSAELTPDKRIQCPKCETIFPVPAHLLPGGTGPGGTARIGADLTSGVGAESPRVQLVGMEDYLSPGPAAPAPAASPTPQAAEAGQAASPSEPWQQELASEASPELVEGEATQAWEGELSESAGETPAERPRATSDQEDDVFADVFEGSERQPASAGSPAESPGSEAVEEVEGEAAVSEEVSMEEHEEVDFDVPEEAPAKKSSWWVWLLVVVLLLVVLAGGVVLAWYMGWLDPVLEMLGLSSPKPSVQAPVLPSPVTAGRPADQPDGAASKPVSPTDSPGAPGSGGGPAQPAPPGLIPNQSPFPPDLLAKVEQVFTEAPARPVADMLVWRYVPPDANLVICLNFQELTQHPTVRALLRESAKKPPLPGKPAQLGLSAPFEPENVAEMLLAFRVDWNELSQEAFQRSAVGVMRFHKPLDEQKLRQMLEATATDVRTEQLGERTLYFGKDALGNQEFACLLAPNLFVVGSQGREKLVPGLGGTPLSSIAKEWETLARGAGNAQVAVLARDIQLSEALKGLAAAPPEAQKFVPSLEKIRHAVLKLELTPQLARLQLAATVADPTAAKDLASLLQQLYQDQIKPQMSQLAAFAPELVQDIQKTLDITAQQDVAQITVGASYPAIVKAAQTALAFLGPAMLGGKPAFPVPPPPKKP